MIPWNRLKTPQAAYEWAKKRAGKTLFFTRSTEICPGHITVWTSKDGWIRKAFNNWGRQ